MDSLSARLRLHLDDVIDAALRRERIVGAVCLVAVEGEVAYVRSAGFADREHKTAMREDAILRLASLTKPMVSAAALALVADGTIGFDEPIATWLPEFRPRTDDGKERVITVRHLLTHTAGLDYGFGARRAEFARLGIGSGLDRPGLGAEEQLRRLAMVPLNFVPGTGWMYSLATDVLGLLLASATGTDLPVVIRRLVTGPLRMSDTGFRVRDTARLATAYADGMPRPVAMQPEHDVPTDAGIIRFCPERVFDDGSFPSGGAGMVGSASDFLRFLEALRSGGAPILDRPFVELMTSDQLPTQVSYPVLGWRFGMGTAVLTQREIACTPHNLGTWRWGGGYGHDWFVDPARKLTVVSMTNTAFEGSDGAYPANVRDAVYYALSAD